MSCGLQCMADGMTEVQHRAVVLFALVFLHDSRFDRTGRRDDLNQKLTIQAKDLLDFFFEETKQSCIFNNPVLNHFSQTGNELAPGQRLQYRDIY